MPSIVEYSTHKRALNAYPRRIVSTTFPGRCCPSAMVQVGEVQEEQGWPFVCRRCAICGFTVRRFASRTEVLEEIRSWKKVENMLLTPDAA